MCKSTIFLLLLFCCNIHSVFSFNASQTVRNLLKNYDNQFPPNIDSKHSVDVGITLYVLSINSISDILMDMSIDMYFRQSWIDQRLSYNPPFEYKSKKLYLPADAVWAPDTFFPTAKVTTFHFVTQRNIFYSLLPNGKILQSSRISAVLNCPMNFKIFPLDSQICSLEIESYAFQMSEVRYLWEKGSGSVGLHKMFSSEYKMLGHRMRTTNVNLSSGNYSRLAVDFAFARNSGPYILTIYFPSTLIVILSWLGFWLNPSSKSARICLGIVNMLIMVDLLVNIHADTPKTSYVKAIDVYIITCLIVVALALVESVFVICFLENDESAKDMEVISESGFKKKWILVVSKLDKFSRIAFPVLFSCFCLLYWIIVLQMSGPEVENLIPFEDF